MKYLKKSYYELNFQKSYYELNLKKSYYEIKFKKIILWKYVLKNLIL